MSQQAMALADDQPLTSNDCVLAIDPGNVESALVIYDGQNVVKHLYGPNEAMLSHVMDWTSTGQCKHLAVEMIASYGMPVGATVFETCVWVGRFMQAWDTVYRHGATSDLVYRKTVKMHLCQTMKAKDGNIRQALIDRFPATGGGKNPTVGTKSQPGPLFGMSGDRWAALAVAVTWWDQNKAAA